MELHEAIKGRRSVRKFKPQTVPEEALNRLIEAAVQAPSAGNTQPWEFVVVKSQNVIKKLAKAAYNQAHVEKAPVVIVVCVNENVSSASYGERGRTLYCLQDTAAATQNILLTAYSLGLGTCWIGAFNEMEAAQVLRAPEKVRPVVMIPVGYPDVAPRQRSKRVLSEVVHFDGF
jgi:nitroreductase